MAEGEKYPSEGAKIRCEVCGARPFGSLWPGAPREDFDLVKIRGEWRCSRHRNEAPHERARPFASRPAYAGEDETS
jgi:hypothetical protein